MTNISYFVLHLYNQNKFSKSNLYYQVSTFSRTMNLQHVMKTHSDYFSTIGRVRPQTKPAENSNVDVKDSSMVKTKLHLNLKLRH